MTSEEYMISHQNVHQQPVLIIFCVISVQPQWKGALARCLSDEIRLHCISERRVIPHDSNRPPGQPSSGTRTPCRPVLRIIATCGGVICCRQGSGVACAVQAIPDTISIGFVYLFFPWLSLCGTRWLIPGTSAGEGSPTRWPPVATTRDSKNRPRPDLAPCPILWPWSPPPVPPRPPLTSFHRELWRAKNTNWSFALAPVDFLLNSTVH